MADKIIINGVDVSGCPCLQFNHIFPSICSLKNGKPDTPDFNCEAFPDCSFKMTLARKDERIRKLEKKLALVHDAIKIWQKIIAGPTHGNQEQYTFTG